MCAGLDITKKVDGEIQIDNVRADFTYTTMEGSYPGLRYNIKVQPLSKVSDETLQGQECDKTYETVQQLYDASKNIVTSLDNNITIGNIWD